MLTALPTRASRFAMLPCETPQDAAARLGLPCEVVPTRNRGVIVVGRLSQLQVDAELRYWYRREVRADREPLAAPAPVPEPVTG